MNGTTLLKGFIPLSSGGQAVYTSSGLAYYRHTDHLGSSRFASAPTRTMYSDSAYSAFGEPYAQAGSIDSSFTGQDQDTTAGVYDFLMRKYDPGQSRWISPDPAGLAAVDPTNPQSWNRYAYVINNPLALTDPSGLGPTSGVACLLDEMGNCRGGGGGGSCTIDGFAADCGLANGLLQSGVGIICNNCGIGTQAVLGPGGVTLIQQWMPPQLTQPNQAGDPILAQTGYWQTIGISQSTNASWLGTFAWNFASNFVSPQFYKQEIKQGGYA
jgi:RHS repeat-associated protein